MLHIAKTVTLLPPVQWQLPLTRWRLLTAGHMYWWQEQKDRGKVLCSSLVWQEVPQSSEVDPKLLWMKHDYRQCLLSINEKREKKNPDSIFILSTNASIPLRRYDAIWCATTDLQTLQYILYHRTLCRRASCVQTRLPLHLLDRSMDLLNVLKWTIDRNTIQYNVWLHLTHTLSLFRPILWPGDN